MAGGGKMSSIKGLLNPASQTSQKGLDPKRKRFRRAKSAPLAEIDHPGEIKVTNVSQSLPRSKALLNKIHPSFRKMFLFLIFYVAIGTICFYFVRDQIKGIKTDRVLDSVYFCIVTMTSVGYGDLAPNSPTTKLLACAFVFMGMVLIGLLLSKAADYLVEKQEVLLIKAMNLTQKVGPSDIIKEMETKKVWYKCFMMMAFVPVIMVVCTVFLSTIEKLDFVDAFYCVCATMTTLGLVDVCFSTKGGRVFAVFWMVISTISMTLLLCYIAELNTEKKQKSLVKLVLNRKMTSVDLEAADIDGDGRVGATEFVLYKLKEMGKINQEDISLLLNEFENLDVDQNGTLSAGDLTLAQSAES